MAARRRALTVAELEEALAAVKPTSRFRLFGVTQRDIDLVHVETRRLCLQLHP